MKAIMRHFKYLAYARKWQKYKVCMTRQFMFYRKRHMQSKSLQSGG